MAKTGSRILLAVLATVLLVSCGTTVVRPSGLMASPRPWLPTPSPQPAASSHLEPPPPLIAAVTSPERDPAQILIHQSQKEALLAARREGDKHDTDRLLEEFRAKEVESWKQTQAVVWQQAEPLLLEQVLRLNIPEDSQVPVDLQRILLATTSDLPLKLNEQVLKYVNYFLRRGRNTLRESLRRAGSYRPMISRILSEEGVPQDLIYLVQAESGFRPQARSRKKATGMWQFVAGRGREYGLNQNRHVDERLDPEKATRAAGRHLADLYAQFGNWHLAMAAYNCGPGCVQRGVERTGYADYWEMVRRGVLPRETSNYVPVILAMALLAKNAEAFQLDDVVPESPIDYDTVQTGSRISLPLIADLTGTSIARIKQLNPALLGQSTPDVPYALRVPKHTSARFLQEIEVIPEARRQSWRRHEVRPNQTLTQIAALYKVRAPDIVAVNQLGPEGPSRGDRITIPVAPRPAVLRAEGGDGRSQPGRYRVRSGDTLGSIARHHRVTVAQLQNWNGLRGTRLQAGQVLKVRAPSAPVLASRNGAKRAAGTKPGSGSSQSRAAVPPRSSLASANGN